MTFGSILYRIGEGQSRKGLDFMYSYRTDGKFHFSPCDNTHGWKHDNNSNEAMGLF